jgi:hypothetical protein
MSAVVCRPDTEQALRARASTLNRAAFCSFTEALQRALAIVFK